MTSSLLNTSTVNLSSSDMSQPMSNGEETSAQSVICVICSLGVSRVGWIFGPQPTLPTTSMSGSFQCPGPAYFSCPLSLKPILDKLIHVSVMSPVVRQRLPPTSAPQVHTSPLPYWQRL